MMGTLRIVFVLLAFLMPFAAHAQVGMFERGLLQVQLKKYSDAADLWRAYADDRSVSDDDAEKREAGLAYVLATIAYQQANDDRAYSAWAKAVEVFLRQRTDWPGERERLKRRIKEFDKAATAAATSEGGGFSLSKEEQALLSVNSLLKLTQFEGPRKGLTGQSRNADKEVITVARNYVARPLGLGPVAPSQKNRGKGVQAAAGRPKTNGASRLSRGFAGSKQARPAPLPRARPASAKPAKAEPKLRNLIIKGSLAYDEPVQTRINLAGNLKRRFATSGQAAGEEEETPALDTAETPQNALVSRSGAPRSKKSLTREERKLARTAWQYFLKAHQSNTGLYMPIQGYPFASPWELASGLAGLVSARQLNLIDQKNFGERIGLMLRSLRDMPLFNQELPNRGYDVRSGMMVDIFNRPSNKGSGWSAIDIGRLLIWLKITAEWHPEHADLIKSIVERWSFDRLIKKGEMQGALLDLDQETLWQEGRQGYEQYAAWGYSVWGHGLPNALDLSHSKPDKTIGTDVLIDGRNPVYLTPDPYYLLRFELQPDSSRVRSTLDRVGDLLYLWHQSVSENQDNLIALGEDSIDADPWFLFNVPSRTDGPWTCRDSKDGPGGRCQILSAKTAFAWSVLYDDDFSAKLRKDASGLVDPRHGFYAGYYDDGSPNRALSINTNAIILEAFAFKVRGRVPFLKTPDQVNTARTSLVRR